MTVEHGVPSAWIGSSVEGHLRSQAARPGKALLKSLEESELAGVSTTVLGPESPLLPLEGPDGPLSNASAITDIESKSDARGRVLAATGPVLLREADGPVYLTYR